MDDKRLTLPSAAAEPAIIFSWRFGDYTLMCPLFPKIPHVRPNFPFPPPGPHRRCPQQFGLGLFSSQKASLGRPGAVERAVVERGGAALTARTVLARGENTAELTSVHAYLIRNS
jgi:hypothetical protein